MVNESLGEKHITLTEHDLLLRLLYGHKGIDRVITAEKLGDQIGVEARTIREMVRNLRLKGNPIVGIPSKGFFWPLTFEETQRTHRNLWKLVAQVRKVALAFDAGANAMFEEQHEEPNFDEPTLFEEVI